MTFRHKGTIRLTVGPLTTNADTAFQAEKALKQQAKEIDGMVRQYFQIGPRSKAVRLEILDESKTETG